MTATVLQSFEKDLTRFSFAINQLAEGRSNATGAVLLTPGATSTVVTATNCGSSSVPLLSPLTASARAAEPATYISAVRAGSFTIAHAAYPADDQVFGFVCLG